MFFETWKMRWNTLCRPSSRTGRGGGRQGEAKAVSRGRPACSASQYDLPATLAYVRRATGGARVSYVSHSQGGTVMLAALASQPRLAAEALGTVVLMAPVAAANHMQSLPMLALATLNTDSVRLLFCVCGGAGISTLA